MTWWVADNREVWLLWGGPKRQTIMIHTIEQAKCLNQRAGLRWFDPGTLRWFGSRIGSTVYPVTDGCYFVSSEYTGFRKEGRSYTVRFCSDSGMVKTIGEFLAYKTRDSAHRAAKWHQSVHGVKVEA